MTALTPSIRVEQIGNATLYCGDCRAVLAQITRADALITDPPYGVALTKKTNDFRDSSAFDDGASLQASVTYRDTPTHVLGLIEEAIVPALAKCSRAALFPGHRMLFDYPRPASIGTVFVPNGAGRDAWGFGCNNPILFYGKCPYLATGKGSRPNSFTDNQPGERGIDHPCPKPLRWMEWLVNRASLPGEVVLDPFMGSGTTGMACAKLGRGFIGIEIEPSYFEIACNRIAEAQRQPDMFLGQPVPDLDAAYQRNLFDERAVSD